MIHPCQLTFYPGLNHGININFIKAHGQFDSKGSILGLFDLFWYPEYNFILLHLHTSCGTPFSVYGLLKEYLMQFQKSCVILILMFNLHLF